MYKPIITIAFVFVISLQVFAQEYEYVPFPDSGVVWNEKFYNHNEDDEDKTRRENFAVNGEDTIINDISYSKLYMFLDTIFNKNTATLEVSGKIACEGFTIMELDFIDTNRISNVLMKITKLSFSILE